MSTTFGIIKNDDIIKYDEEKEVIWDDDYDYIEIAKRIDNGWVWLNDLGELLPNHIKIYTFDNSPNGIFTIGDIRRDLNNVKGSGIFGRIIENIPLRPRIEVNFKHLMIDVCSDFNGKRPTDKQYELADIYAQQATLDTLKEIEQWCLDGCPRLDELSESIERLEKRISDET
jgi:hypothetical protein